MATNTQKYTRGSEGAISIESAVKPLVVPALPLVSFLLWLCSIYEGRLGINRGMGELGLVSVLPLSFFLSLSLLTICFLATLKVSRSQSALFYEVMMLIAFLYLTPAMIEGGPRFSNTYNYYQAVDYISQTGHIDPILQWVHTWPAFSILFSTLVQIAGLARTSWEQVLLTLFPALFNIALFWPLLSLLRMILNEKNFRWIAIWVFYIEIWIGIDYFSVQSFAFFVFVLLVLVLFKLMDSQVQRTPWLLISTLLFCYLVTSHLLTSLASFMVIFALFTFKHFRRPAVLLLFAIILAAWTTYGAAIRLPWGILVLATQAFNLEFIFQANVAARMAGSAAHAIVTQARLIFSASVVLLAFCGFALTHRREKSTKMEREIVLTSLGVCSLLGFSAYGGELFMRILLLNLVTLAYFISRASDRKWFFVVIAVFLIVSAPPLNIVAHYGNEVMDYVPVSEMEGVKFFQDKTNEGYLIYLSIFYRDLRYHESTSYFSFFDGGQWKNNAIWLPAVGPQHNGQLTFVCVSYVDKKYYDFYLGQRSFVPEMTKNLDGSSHYNRVYSNPGYGLYAQLGLPISHSELGAQPVSDSFPPGI